MLRRFLSILDYLGDFRRRGNPDQTGNLTTHKLFGRNGTAWLELS